MFLCAFLNAQHTLSHHDDVSKVINQVTDGDEQVEAVLRQRQWSCEILGDETNISQAAIMFIPADEQ